MPSILFDQKKQYVPGAYTKTEVRSSLPGALPLFHVAMILGNAPTGRPYNAEDTALEAEGDVTPWERCGTPSKVATVFGAESDLHVGARYAWRHKLPQAYVVNLAPLTRASIDLLAAATVEQLTIYPKAYGAPANGMTIAYNATTDVLTIVPVKSFAMLASNVNGGTTTRIYTRGQHGWIKANGTVLLVDNDGSPEAVVVREVGEEIDANRQRAYWFEVATAPAENLTTGKYAMVYILDTAKTVTGTGLGTPQKVLDFINTDPQARTLVVAERHANYTGADLVTLAATGIGFDATSTAGTSPTGGNTELAAFIAAQNAGNWDRFVDAEQAIPQAYLALLSDATSHGTARDYAIAERVRNYPISFTLGCGWGDVVVGAGDATDPTYRAGVLNSEDVTLCANGLDRLGAHLSLAPAIFGLRCSGGPGHNLTNDTLLYAELETLWDEIDSGELTALLKAGVVTTKLSIGQSIGYTVAQGLSTLQNNDGAIWNEVDATTWSLMQRDLADFANIVLKRDLESLQIGADKVDPVTIGAVLSRRAAKSLLAQGYITDWAIESITINASGSGYDVVWRVKLPTTSDFITLTTVILLGD